jgi:hypothetical protein
VMKALSSQLYLVNANLVTPGPTAQVEPKQVFAQLGISAREAHPHQYPILCALQDTTALMVHHPLLSAQQATTDPLEEASSTPIALLVSPDLFVREVLTHKNAPRVFTVPLELHQLSLVPQVHMVIRHV